MDHHITASTTLGFDGHQAALVTRYRGRPHVAALWEISPEAVNPLYSNFPQDVARPPKDILVVTGVQASEVLIRPLEVQLLRERDIAKVAKFQAEPIIPYPLEEALLDWHKTAKTEKGSRLLAYVVRKERVSEHLKHLQNITDPEVVSCVPEAMKAFFMTFCPDTPSAVLVHMGLRETACVPIVNGHIAASYSLDTGCEELYKAVAKDFGVTFEEAQKKLHEDIDVSLKTLPENLQEALENIKKQIARTLYAIDKTMEGPLPLLVTGRGACVRGFESLLAVSCDKKLAKVPPNSNVEGTKLQSFAGAIGLAMTALGSRARPINFRQEEFTFPRPWKRLKKPILQYAVGCLVITTLILWLGGISVAHKESRLQGRYGKLLAATQQTFQDTENAYAKKRGTTPAAALETLSDDDIAARVAFLQGETRDTAPFPLFPKVPRVSDILAFLAVHPQVVGDHKTSLIHVESLSYTMVKPPDAQHPRDKYVVRVDLEFSAPSPREAREFHDALITPNDIVDAQNEVKWDTVRGHYHASFFLKDKTVYFGGP